MNTLAALWRWSPVITVPLAALLVAFAVAVAPGYRALGLTPYVPYVDPERSPLLLAATEWVAQRTIPPVPSLDVDLELRIAPEAQARLDEALPASGRRWQDAELVTADGTRSVRARYRGDSGFHWLYPHRSWRIKTSKTEQLDGVRTFNLDLPKGFGETFSNHAGYALGRQLGLLTPRTALVTFGLNGQHEGLRLLVEQTNEQFLRAQNLLPGDLYEGDMSGIGEVVLTGLEPLFEPSPATIPYVFAHPWMWERRGHRDQLERDHDAPIAALLDRLARGESVGDLVDVGDFARFSAFLTLGQVHHLTRQHNWKLHHDYSLGRLRPVVWDPLAWFPMFLGPETRGVQPDLPNTLLWARLYEEPEFRAERQRVLGDFFTEGKAPFLAALRQDVREGLDELPPAVPFFDLAGVRVPGPELRRRMQAFPDGVEAALDELSGQLYGAPVQASWWPADGGVVVRVEGPRAVRRLVVRHGEESRYDQAVLPEVEVLRPPRPDPQRFADSVRRSPGLGFVATPGVDPATIESVTVIGFGPGEPTAATRGSGPAPSVAPPPAPDPVVWSGTVDLTADLRIDAPLVVEAGTRIRLGAGVLVQARGGVQALGTSEQPIQIGRLDPEDPWGAFLVLGGPPSHFEHARFAGGSDAVRDTLIADGMVSVHGAVAHFVDCSFTDSSADDQLHLAYAEVLVQRSRLDAAQGDGLDADQSRLEVLDSHFEGFGDDALDLMGGEALVARSSLAGGADKCLSAGERAAAVVLESELRGCAIGVQVKDGAELALFGGRLVDNGVAADARVKEWRYDDGGRAWLAGAGIEGERGVAEEGSSLRFGEAVDPCGAAIPGTWWLGQAREDACGD